MRNARERKESRKSYSLYSGKWEYALFHSSRSLIQKQEDLGWQGQWGKMIYLILSILLHFQGANPLGS